MDNEGLISRAALKESGNRRRVTHSRVLEREEFM